MSLRLKKTGIKVNDKQVLKISKSPIFVFKYEKCCIFEQSNYFENIGEK